MHAREERSVSGVGKVDWSIDDLVYFWLSALQAFVPEVLMAEKLNGPSLWIVVFLDTTFRVCRLQVRGALEAAGYRTSGMHNERLALKTDAPDAAVWDVLRCWIRDNPQPPPVRPSGASILARAPHFITNAMFNFPKSEKACTTEEAKVDSDG